MSFESFVRLGWSFFKTVLRNAFSRRSQLPRFVSQYRPDGMLVLEEGDHAVMVGAGRCIGCGACDVRAIELGAFTALGPRGPMAFVVGVSRQAGVDAPLGDEVSHALLNALEAACPVAVPFVPLATLVRRRHAELREAKALPAFRESMVPPGLSSG